MLPHLWRRFLSTVRLLLSLSCLVTSLIASSGSITESVVLFAAYAVYSGVVLFWKSLEQSGYPLMALSADFLFFFLYASGSSGYSYWISSVFYAYILVVAVMLHTWARVVIVTGASISLLYVTSPLHASVLLPVFICGGIVAVVLAVQKAWYDDRLASAAKQSVLYRYDAEKARDSERQRIAADFHDGPLQSFISFQMRLEIIRKLLMRDQRAAVDELVQLQDLCKTQVTDLRTFVRSMRPVDVDGSLSSTIGRIVEQFQKDSGISASFVSTEFLEPADPEVSLELLQIVREALYNIQKHAGATRVTVSARKKDGGIEISVEDNGNGFPFSGVFSLDELDMLRLGPISIKRRVRTLGGDLKLDSRPGQGAGLLVRLAMSAAA
ncbi:MAG: sensor histidine kinase [Bryobacteraceae bacterium]|jgi:signal transduction histidine kinase